MTLTRLTMEVARSTEISFGGHECVQAEADRAADSSLLDVNIAHAPCDRFEEQRVDELDGSLLSVESALNLRSCGIERLFVGCRLNLDDRFLARLARVLNGCGLARCVGLVDGHRQLLGIGLVPLDRSAEADLEVVADRGRKLFGVQNGFDGTGLGLPHAVGAASDGARTHGARGRGTRRSGRRPARGSPWAVGMGCQ